MANMSDAAATRLEKLQELFADAPELGKAALKNAIAEIAQTAPADPSLSVKQAGRIGSRIGAVSELTVIFPFAEGGAKRLRGLLQLLNGDFSGADLVGTVHNMRFVFLDNDTKLLFATAYDGDWDPYIDDFATKIPDLMDVLGSNFEGYPGIRSPEVKDYIAKYQLPAEGWYVANPKLTVAEGRRLQRVGEALDTFLDKIGN